MNARWIRALCLALLLANIVYFVRARWLQEPPRASDALPSGLTKIALASEVPKPPTRRCITLGPFRSDADVVAATNLLREVGYAPRPRDENADVNDGYLVLVTGIRSSTQLNAAMTRLRRAGIADAAIVPDGTPGIRVSVGQFPQLPQAEQRAAAVRKLGMNADVMERLAPGAITWLDIDLRAAGEEFDAQSLKADGSLQVKPCPSAS